MMTDSGFPASKSSWNHQSCGLNNIRVGDGFDAGWNGFTDYAIDENQPFRSYGGS
jgi:hypothetical protein